ncbi:MAG: exonuclease subunit SbcD [Treponema sp.]|nr:exonuclease subunit SbcD [Treponema sp.]
MKFLHTADWHLGKSLYDVSRLDEQRGFLNQIIQIFGESAKNEPYDALFVSGDIYDKAVASTDAINLLDDFLICMNRKFPEAHIFITSGNHDSAARLGFAAKFLEKSNIHISCSTDRIQTPTIVKNAAVYQIPFLVPGSFPAEDDFSSPPRTQKELFQKAVALITESHAKNHGGFFPVVLAHGTVFGSDDDEGAAQVGALDSIPPALFKDFCYTALGHIHKCQRLDKGDRMYYSGSPLAYSFDDAGEKQFLSGTIDGSGKVKIEKIPVATAHPLVRLSGSMDDFLQNQSYDKYKEHFVEIRCTDTMIHENPKLLLKERFPHILSFVREQSISMKQNADFRVRRKLVHSGEAISERTLFESFLRDMHSDALDEQTAQKESALFGDFFSRAKNEEDEES